MLLWIAIAMLVACGAIDPRVATSTNPEFYPYVRTFEAETGRSCDAFPINFLTVDELNAGEAWTYSTFLGPVCEIAIDETFWRENVERARRELLISHELGHCFGLQHNKDMFINYEPKSFMYPSVAQYTLEYFDAHRDYYYGKMRGDLYAMEKARTRPIERDNFRH